MLRDMPIKEKFVRHVLDAVRKSAVKNAGAASIKGTFEPQIPEKLRATHPLKKNKTDLYR